MIQVERIGMTVLVFVGLLLTAKAEESIPQLKVRSEDAVVAIKAVDFEAKKSSTGSHQIGFRFSVANTDAKSTKNGQLFFKAFDKDGFELVDPGRLYEVRTTLKPGEVRKAVSTQFFPVGQWEKVREVELYWKSLKGLDN
jgi:hypothetical protein